MVVYNPRLFGSRDHDYTLEKEKSSERKIDL